MMKKPCKECPWVIKNRNNNSLTNHAKRLNKTHNCHMIDSDKRGELWDTKKDCQCVGNKMFFESESYKRK